MAVEMVLGFGPYSFMFAIRGWAESGAGVSLLCEAFWADDSNGSRSPGVVRHLCFRERPRQGNMLSRTCRAEIAMVEIYC